MLVAGALNNGCFWQWMAIEDSMFIIAKGTRKCHKKDVHHKSKWFFEYMIIGKQT